MTDAEILPIHGNQDTEFSLSIMVVSSGNTLRTKLTDALLGQGQRQRLQYKLFAHSCESLQQILPVRSEIHMDFIIFVVDSNKEGWLNEIGENLKYLDTAFFFGRFCFALTEGTDPKSIAVNVRLLREQYRCNILVINDIMNSEKWITLAERVLNLCTAVCGLKSGMSPCISL